MDDNRPRLDWVYRGQSTKGIGEGPGQSVAHGEQYLDASKNLKDAKLLEVIRPWMTLDSDPVDHERLKDGLEAWPASGGPAGNRGTAGALAGVYDLRVAYFSQGFAWDLDSPMSPGFDPGLFLGQSEAFEKPWRDKDPGMRTPELGRVESAPWMTRPKDVEGNSPTPWFLFWLICFRPVFRGAR